MSNNDYSYNPPNKRYRHTGFFYPSMNAPDLGNIHVYLDTSGSHFSPAQQQRAITEIKGILTSFDKATLTLFYVDHYLQGEPVEVDPTDPDPVFMPKGGGGTSFRPPFNYVKENDLQPKAAVYLTDGYCNDFPEEPDFETLWILTEENPSFNPPFGETITMDQEE